MENIVVLITGGNSGLGRAAATELAGLGATVVILARNQERAHRALKEITSLTGNENLHVLLADLASLKSVRSAVDEFKERFGRLDVLINNAALNSPTRTETVEGFEIHFGVNYLSHYLLTRLLLDVLEQSAPARIINVGARQMGAKLDFEDLHIRSEWTTMKAITQSKLAMLLFTRELDKRLAGENVTVNILDPGLVNTEYHQEFGLIHRTMVKLLGKDATQAVDPYVYLATSNEMDGVSGRFFGGRKEVQLKGQALDANAAERLWNESAAFVGLD